MKFLSLDPDILLGLFKSILGKLVLNLENGIASKYVEFAGNFIDFALEEYFKLYEISQGNSVLCDIVVVVVDPTRLVPYHDSTELVVQ